MILHASSRFSATRLRRLFYLAAALFGLCALLLGGAGLIDRWPTALPIARLNLAEATAALLGGAAVLGWGLARALGFFPRGGSQSAHDGEDTHS